MATLTCSAELKKEVTERAAQRGQTTTEFLDEVFMRLWRMTDPNNLHPREIQAMVMHATRTDR